MILDARDVKIMVVEPDRTVLELIQIRLGVAGYDIRTARSGALALEVLRSFRPAAMVMELHMPEISGFDMLRTMNPRGERLPFPVLVMARNLAADEIRRAIGLGARDCMTKPFSGTDVVERVARMLRREAAQQAAPVSAAAAA